MASIPKANIFQGTHFQAGKAYGAKFRKKIAGFHQQEFGNYKINARFLHSVDEIVKLHAPSLHRFIEGMAEESYLSYKQHLKVLLHEEELYHRVLGKRSPHCNTVGVVQKNKKVLLAQTWDWATCYLPWADFNCFDFNGRPEITTLSFPGLPMCAGMNSAGLSLLWTGSGYYPPVMPKVGLPTYGLIFEILQKKNISAVIRFLDMTPNAGAFIFFLGDRSGRLTVVEGVPDRYIVEDVQSATRANVYEFEETIKFSKQKLPSLKHCHSLLRQQIFRESKRPIHACRNEKDLNTLLNQKNIRIDTRAHASLYELHADCMNGVFSVRSWVDDYRIKRFSV